MSKDISPHPGQVKATWVHTVYHAIEHSPELNHVSLSDILVRAGITRRDLFLDEVVDYTVAIKFHQAALELCGPEIIPITGRAAQPSLLGIFGVIVQTAPTLADAFEAFETYKTLYAPNSDVLISQGDSFIELQVTFDRYADEGVESLFLVMASMAILRVAQTFPGSDEIRVGYSTSGNLLSDRAHLLMDALFGVDAFTRRPRKTTAGQLIGIEHTPGAYRWNSEMRGTEHTGFRIIAPIKTARILNPVFPPHTFRRGIELLAAEVRDGSIPIPKEITTSTKMGLLMRSQGGLMDKQTVAKRLSMTPKTLERRIKDDVGLTFKQHRSNILAAMYREYAFVTDSDLELSRKLGFNTLQSMWTNLSNATKDPVFPSSK